MKLDATAETPHAPRLCADVEVARSSPSSPMYRVPSSEMLAVLRAKQPSTGAPFQQHGGSQHTGTGIKCFTDEACGLAGLDARDMQVCPVAPSRDLCDVYLVPWGAQMNPLYTN